MHPAVENRDIIVEGIKCRVLTRYRPDSNDLVVFFPGLACIKESFVQVFEHQAFEHASLLLIDLIGFGDSAKPDNFTYHMEDQARICERVIEKFPAGRIHLVAHSMGGAVALLLSDELMKKAVTFANLEGNLSGDDCALISRPTISQSFEEYESSGFDDHAFVFNRCEIMDFDKTRPFVMYTSAKSLVEWSESGALLDKFIDLQCRKAYFYGEYNQDMPILKQLGEVPKIMIEQSGHLMMLENPDVFYQKLAEFLFPHGGGALIN